MKMNKEIEVVVNEYVNKFGYAAPMRLHEDGYLDEKEYRVAAALNRILYVQQMMRS